MPGVGDVDQIERFYARAAIARNGDQPAKLRQRKLVQTSLILSQCKTVPSMTSSVEFISRTLMSTCGN
jgi:hypothetical protein